MRRIALLLACLVLVAALRPLYSQQANPDAHMKGAFRKPAQNGWVFVHLQGSPFDIGFQHGYLTASEINDAEKVLVLELAHSYKKDWKFFRNAARYDVAAH